MSEDELEFDEHGRAVLNGTLFSGVAWESPSGDLYMSEVRYEAGLEHGLSVDWYETGKMAARHSSLHGTKHGVEEEWFRDGARRLRVVWENGLRVKLQRWDQAGTLVEDWALAADDPRRQLAADLQRGVQIVGASIKGHM